MLKIYLDIAPVVYNVSGRSGKGIRNQQIGNGGIRVIFRSGDIPVSSDLPAAPPLAHYITQIVLHVSVEYQLGSWSTMLRD
jgi:hypothetical protein